MLVLGIFFGRLCSCLIWSGYWFLGLVATSKRHYTYTAEPALTHTGWWMVQGLAYERLWVQGGAMFVQEFETADSTYSKVPNI